MSSQVIRWRPAKNRPQAAPASLAQPQASTASSPSPSKQAPSDDLPERNHDIGTLGIALAKLRETSEYPKIPALKDAADIALTLDKRYRDAETHGAKFARYAVHSTAALCEYCPESPNERVGRRISEFIRSLKAIHDDLNQLSLKTDSETPSDSQTYVYKFKTGRNELTMDYQRFLMSLGFNYDELVFCMLQMEENVDGPKQEDKDFRHRRSGTVRSTWTELVLSYLYVLIILGTFALSWTASDLHRTAVQLKERITRDNAYDISKPDGHSQFGMGQYDPAYLRQISKTLSTQPRINPLPMVDMPPMPRIFYGREDHVEKIVDLIIHKPDARIAILGPGGIGKTSVALAVIQHPRIKNTFNEDHMYWVPCENATSFKFFVNLLAKSLDVPKNSDDRLTDIVNTLKIPNQHHIILLDNFDTIMEIRGKAFGVKSILSAIALPNVNILVTMRGTLPPSTDFLWIHHLLQPISLDAARHAFLDTYPEAKSDNRLDELLLALDCVPLAVDLMASKGPRFTPTELLGRWRDEGTRMLRRADHRLDYLDHSIRISLKSSSLRSNPDALKLLAVLSMFPGGAQKHVVEKIIPRFWNLDACLNTLIQASLAYRSPSDAKIHVLSTIQSYMLRYYELYPSTRQRLYKTYYALAEQGDCIGGSECSDAVKALLEEEVNMQSVLLHALHHGDRLESITASMQYTRYLHRTTPNILVISGGIMTAWLTHQDDSLLAKCLQLRAETFLLLMDTEEARIDFELAQGYFQKAGDRTGEAQCARSIEDIDRMREYAGQAAISLSTMEYKKYLARNY